MSIEKQLKKALNEQLKEQFKKEIARQKKPGEKAEVIEKNGEISIQGDKALVERVLKSLK